MFPGQDGARRKTEEVMTLSGGYWKQAARGLVAALLGLGFLSTEGGAQMKEGNLGVPFTKTRVGPLWAAEKESYFRKNGIEAKILKISRGTQGGEALPGGSI